MAMMTKKTLHRLIDELPQRELAAAARYLAYLRDLGDPLLRELWATPFDDEPTTREEDEGVADAWQEYLRGEARLWEDVRNELARD